MKKLKFVIIPILITLVLIISSGNSFASSSITQEILDRAISNNGNNPNVVILKNGENYYLLGIASSFDSNTVTNGNWIYRNYKNVYGLTSPGWYQIHCQYEPYWNWSQKFNDINSNSFWQLSGDGWSDFSIAYSYKDILNTDGTVYFPAGYASSGDTGDSGNTDTNTVPAPPDYSATGPLSWIADFFDYLGAILKGFFGGINEWLDPTKPNFILKNVEGFLSGVTTSLDPSKPNFILKTVESVLSGITTSLDPSNPNFILKTIESVLSGITSSFDPTSENFIFNVLVEMLRGAFVDLFVPREEVVNGLFAPIREKFAFVDKFQSLSNEIQTMLETGEGAPVFELNLNSKYVSGETKIIDMSFFAPYKPYSDTVITAFVYLLFIYRTVKNLPETVSGLNGINDLRR